MEQQFLSLFESAKTSADAAVTSSSMIPEVHRCVAALAQLKRFPVISSRVLLLTPVAKQVECLTRHPVKMIKAAASCLLYTWRRKLYARHPSIDGKTRLTKSGGVSRNGTLIVKMRGRILGRVEVGMPIKTVKNEEKKVKETETGLSCFKKPPLVPAKQTRKPEEKVENTISCIKKPLRAPAKKIIKPEGKVESIKSGFKKPPHASAKGVTVQEKEKSFSGYKKPPQASAKGVTVQEKEKSFSGFKKPPQASAKGVTVQEKEKSFSGFKKLPQASTTCVTAQEKVKGFGSFNKPSKEPVKCDDALRGKVRSILVESLTRVANETEAGLRRAVSSRDPICVAADVESVMFQKMGAFNGAKTVKYRSVLFNLKDPKNPDLRRKVLLGQIKPEKLVTMTSEEMASNHRQFENAQIRIKSLLKEKKAGQEYKSVDPVES
ncbi:transcription elongation factor TFIIS-like [Populus alba x Populus x berolinensis]|uniref:Transcription elongation factor TFIIS-like n=1 Tax=Populus alba x Populus x berolinensis TaxID=444605 RepID=A0AAD6QKP8_9ROSI|nr:transcription elongation factor TFIIS-like [Populus alba x Populus x berolinensis]